MDQKVENLIAMFAIKWVEHPDCERLVCRLRSLWAGSTLKTRDKNREYIISQLATHNTKWLDAGHEPDDVSVVRAVLKLWPDAIILDGGG